MTLDVASSPSSGSYHSTIDIIIYNASWNMISNHALISEVLVVISCINSRGVGVHITLPLT